MVFSSLIFLCVFLPAVLVVYVICPKSYKNFWLMISSLIFYGWGEPKYILIMLFSTVFDYINGRLLEYFDEQDMEDAVRIKRRKRVLVLSLAGNLGILFIFKYFDLLVSSWNAATSSKLGLLHFALPIGISFYTFQTMSYTIDVYRHEVKAQHNIISFAMYVSMFPQLIAGPIVRYKWVEKQMKERKVTMKQWVAGMQRFLTGLGKKVLFANQIGLLWSDISGYTNGHLSTAEAWLGAFAFTFQIYFDFSGYSDMAIGLGEMFGFHFPENFLHPYESRNIAEFWSRWHISLSGWFRDYLYIPLGGNRKGRPRQIFNLFIVWLLTGFWHGASWNFVIWGLYHCALLGVEKLFLLKEMERWPKVLQHIYGKFFIVVGWMLFANEDFNKMGTYLKTMFAIRGNLVNQTAIYEWRTHVFFLFVLAVFSTTLPKRIWKNIKNAVMDSMKEEQEKKRWETIEFSLYGACTILILLLSVGMLVSDSYNPFLYFRF